MTQSSVLVVLPTLGDRLGTLALTLASIDDQRKEVPLRLVVVAPESASAARDLARQHGATIVSDPKSGISAAINAGIEAAESERYYAWMGDDDMFRPGGLRLLHQIPKPRLGIGRFQLALDLVQHLLRLAVSHP